MTVRVYLDTNILSRIAESPKRIRMQDAEALAKIPTLEGIECCSSAKAMEEVKKTLDEKTRHLLTFVHGIATHVPNQSMESSWGVVPFDELEWEDDADRGKLLAIFDNDDAHHIFNALRSGCAYFLTLDRATILGRVHAQADTVTAVCGAMRFVSPAELISALGRSS